MRFKGGQALGGSTACRFALTQFFAEHPSDSIVSVIPIEAAMAERPEDLTHLVERGTQRLLVIHHTGAGPGTPASQLKLGAGVCTDGSQPIRLRPEHCRAELVTTLQQSQLNRTVMWVPLTDAVGDDGDAVETHEILRLVVPQVTSADRPAAVE